MTDLERFSPMAEPFHRHPSASRGGSNQEGDPRMHRAFRKQVAVHLLGQRLCGEDAWHPSRLRLERLGSCWPVWSTRTRL
jgi:hypothetical protein